MFHDGTLVKLKYQEDILKDPEVENQLSYDSITRTWNGNEKTPAGNRRNNKACKHAEGQSMLGASRCECSL